tara:strand:+ start:432 stop:1034 length:603 start_codon:yes stop_codon:yes gene_type:complete
MDLSYFETVNEDGEVIVNLHETKSTADLERVIALGKPESVVNRFAEMVAIGEQWEWFDNYQAFLLAVTERDEAIANHEPEFDEKGNEIEWLPPEMPVEPIRPVLRTIEEVLNGVDGYSALVKNRGTELLGHTISLNESNQNGIAAVLTGLNLATETGIDMFPISFKAETISGTVSIPFETLEEFKGFSLRFMDARQVFFK